MRLARLIVVLGLTTLAASPMDAQRREARETTRPLRADAIADTAVASLVRAEAAFLRDVAERRADGWVAAFAEDATTLPPNAGFAIGTAPIRAGMTPVFADSATHVVWHPVYATVARSGELGYTYGYYRWTRRDSTGAPARPAEGRFVTLWRRDATGAWKVAMDFGSPGIVPAGFFELAGTTR